ncbi:MAG TPA: PHP domain-containing protein [Candidatus Eisenbacteria bacterium]|nr:PHP domain-containing protein [Candidatus Eisenbacteria bacterium]
MGERSVRDLNMDIAGQLYDMALIHASPHGRMAYKRAAQALLRLDVPVDELASKQPLREIPYIGPASELVIAEALEHGLSPSVATAVGKSRRVKEVREAHAFRTNFLSRAGALKALRSPARGAVKREDYRGDLQMHTEWSDGAESIAGMAKGGVERGYEYIGVSDHSYGLRIARGMSMADVARQHRQIDALNLELNGAFRILKGIEANIPAEGGVDMTEKELASFELVLAAPHSRLRRAEDQTERMLAAVRHPSVRILAHPRGRMYSRQGVLARWDEVFEEAARRDVAVEIDGDPYRQDIDHTLARRALEAGCLLALDSDAHSGDELAYADIALAHARIAKIPPARIVNTWPAAKLLDWAKRKRPRRR